MEDIAALRVAEVPTRAPEGPYHLVGWSFGGPPAYETARLLTERGRQARSLTVLDIPPFDGKPQAWPEGLHEALGRATTPPRKPHRSRWPVFTRSHDRALSVPLVPLTVTYVSFREAADPAADAQMWHRLTGVEPDAVHLEAGRHEMLRPESAGVLAEVLHARFMTYPSE